VSPSLFSPLALSLSLSLDKYTRNFQYRCRMVDSSKSLAARLKRQRNQRGATLIPVRRCRLANPATPRLKRSAIECGRGRGDGRWEGRKNDGWKKSHEGTDGKKNSKWCKHWPKSTSWIWNHDGGRERENALCLCRLWRDCCRRTFWSILRNRVHRSKQKTSFARSMRLIHCDSGLI